MRFIELLNRLGVAYLEGGHTHCRPGWVQIQCPFCGVHGNTPGGWYMGFNIAHGYFNCWRCGKHGVADTLAAATGRHWSDVKPLLENLERDVVADEPRVGTYKPPVGVGPLLPAHVRYLAEERGMDVDYIVEAWGVQGIGPGHPLEWRLFIPIHLRGEAVSWTTRAIGCRVALRYRAAELEEEAVPHKTLLYGEDYVRNAVVICEGPVDVWAIGPGAVATCGTSYSRAQVVRMARYPVRVVCFDTEPAAQLRASGLCDALEAFPGKTYNVQLDAKDPGSAEPKELRLLRETFLE